MYEGSIADLKKRKSMSYFPLISTLQGYLCMSALLLPELRQIVLLLLPVVSTASLCSSGWPLLLLAGGGGGGGVCVGVEHAFC